MTHPQRWLSHATSGLCLLGVAVATAGVPYLVFAQVRPHAHRVLRVDAGVDVGADAGGSPAIAADASNVSDLCAPAVLPLVAPRAMTACRVDRDCVIAMSTYCPPCGWRANVYRAINRGRRNAFARRSCPEQFVGGIIAGVACPACAGGPPEGLGAVCVARMCRMVAPPDEGPCSE